MLIRNLQKGPMLDVVTLGESMIQLVPMRAGRLRHARRFERFVAGAESNTAIGLARLGHRAGWISRLGAGEFGAAVKASIRGEGVDVSQVIHDEAASTGVYFKERRRAGATYVHYYRARSAASGLRPEDLDPTYIQQATYLHLTGITPALSASCRAAVRQAVALARKAGVLVSFDPNIRQKLWPPEEARPVLLSLLAEVDLVLTGAGEAELLAGEADPEAAARKLLEAGPSLVVVKQGAQGALAVSEDVAAERGALSVDVVEPIGAGDAFNAGFLAGQLRGWDLDASLRLGNVAGALAMTAPGDVEGLPTWAEAEAYLRGAVPVER